MVEGSRSRNAVPSSLGRRARAAEAAELAAASDDAAGGDIAA